METERAITAALKEVPQVEAAWVFGSIATGTAHRTSDVDVAVLAQTPLSGATKMQLIEQLAQASGRPVDLIDLQATQGPIVGRVFQEGRQLFCTNGRLYADRLKRWLFDQADWIPYRRRIIEARREKWIGS